MPAAKAKPTSSAGQKKASPAVKGSRVTKRKTPSKSTPSTTKTSSKTSTKPKAKAEPQGKSNAPTKSPSSSQKRTSEEHGERASKRPRTTKAAKAPKAKPVLNYAPAKRLDVYVYGAGSGGELGLGTPSTQVDVKRPRLNANLAADKVGVVQVACGGMHALALTHNGIVLSWGINDDGALGRDTAWEGGMRDIDDSKSDDSDEDADADAADRNPREFNPAAVTFPEETVITKVAAGDSISLALTNEGRVYGWGTFRNSSGKQAFWRDTSAGTKKYRDSETHTEEIQVRGVVETQRTPHLYTELTNIVDVVCGANHCVARDKKGQLWAWGWGEQHQLGRRLVERHDVVYMHSLLPSLMRTGRTVFSSIFTGPDHSFAIDNKHRVYAWGLNGFGNTGLRDFTDTSNTILEDVSHPTIVKSLSDDKNPIVRMSGGQKNSLAIRADGAVLVWGQIDAGTLGVDVKTVPRSSIIYDPAEGKEHIPRVIIDPFALPRENFSSHAAVYGTCGSGHSIVLNQNGQVYTWGLNTVFQCGVGNDNDVELPTLVENTAVRGKKISWAGAGGQYSVLTAVADFDEGGKDVPMVNGI